MKRVLAIVGARPQFIKHAAVEKAAAGSIQLHSLHTGQHYDQKMSAVFFDELGIAEPTYRLSAGGGSHGEQTGQMLIEIERILLDNPYEAVLVYGDTNSTIAGALAAVKLHIPVVHIEAGLRSHNMAMPEEVNRVLTDHCSSLLLTTGSGATETLKNEQVAGQIEEVGDVMKDMVRLPCIGPIMLTMILG